MGGVTMYLVSNYWAGLESELQAKPTTERLEQILTEIKFAFGIVYGVMWFSVATLLYQGIKMLRANQFPLPTAKVIRDTPILRGKAARARAFTLIGLATVLVALLVVLAVMGMRVLEYVQKAT